MMSIGTVRTCAIMRLSGSIIAVQGKTRGAGSVDASFSCEEVLVHGFAVILVIR